jgi:hypothetical protein
VNTATKITELPALTTDLLQSNSCLVEGSQFISKAFTNVFKQHDTRISIDGKGSWIDNVFIERLCRSVKYEEVYLQRL